MYGAVRRLIVGKTSPRLVTGADRLKNSAFAQAGSPDPAIQARDLTIPREQQEIRICFPTINRRSLYGAVAISIC
jgi:hypothetical protein